MERFIRLTDQMMKEQGITEALKAENMLVWIQRMNAVREQADAIIELAEIIAEIADVDMRCKNSLLDARDGLMVLIEDIAAK